MFVYRGFVCAEVVYAGVLYNSCSCSCCSIQQTVAYLIYTVVIKFIRFNVEFCIIDISSDKFTFVCYGFRTFRQFGIIVFAVTCVINIIPCNAFAVLFLRNVFTAVKIICLAEYKAVCPERRNVIGRIGNIIIIVVDVCSARKRLARLNLVVPVMVYRYVIS